MSHYEHRLAEDLAGIRSAMDDVASDIVSALERSVRGIQDHDRALLYEVVLDDLSVNRKIRAIDKLCHSFVARHLPAAGHLRFVSSVLRLTVALERAGDYAVTISRVVLQLERELSPEIVARVAQLAELSGSMLADSVHAFLEGNVELARDTRTRGITIDRVYDEFFHELVNEQPRRPSLELASLLTIFGKIERVSDQAKNICEETVFAGLGELKQPKIFRVLFLDERNDLVSHLAVAIAWKSFKEGGIFSSAGWAPAGSVDGRLAPIGDRFGLDVGRARPKKVKEALPDYPIDYHVIVALNAGPDAPIPRIPYHTILQRWDDLPRIPAPDEAAESDPVIDAVVRELSVAIRELMERLRGPG